MLREVGEDTTSASCLGFLSVSASRAELPDGLFESLARSESHDAPLRNFDRRARLRVARGPRLRCDVLNVPKPTNVIESPFLSDA